jgi:hypothetical protein
MKLDDLDPLLSRASDHLAMAIRLRDTAARLQTDRGRDKLVQLASLYEQLSLHLLEESRAVSAHRRGRSAFASLHAEVGAEVTDEVTVPRH